MCVYLGEDGKLFLVDLVYISAQTEDGDWGGEQTPSAWSFSSISMNRGGRSQLGLTQTPAHVENPSE